MRHVHVLNDAEALAREASGRFVAAATEAIAKRGVFLVALSGGNTPKLMFEHLAAPSVAVNVDWTKVVVFWGDERQVPADDPQSNYRMAREALLRYVPLTPGNVHRWATELGDAAAVAQDYERQLREVAAAYPACCASDGWPRFDLILLGIGDDGHTASLFPDAPLPDVDRKPWMIAPWVPHLNAFRVSFSAELIDRAREIVFLVSGAKKADVISRILATPTSEQADVRKQYPAARVEGQVDTEIFWLLDAEAAAQLRAAA